jgi:hypothetical protein
MQTHKSTKSCATCKYWGGTRSIIGDVISPACYGQCNNISAQYNQYVYSMSICQKYTSINK